MRIRYVRLVLFASVSLGVAAACGGGAFLSGPTPTSCGAGDDGAACDATTRDALAESAAQDSAAADAVLDSGSDALVVVPHCAGAYACIPAIPVGYSGPFELYVGTAAPPACGSAFQGQTLDGNDGLDAGAAACACTCGAPQDAGCGAPTVDFYPLGSCTAAPCGATEPPASECLLLDAASACLAPTGLSMSAGAPTTRSGACPPVPTTHVAPVRWGESVRACASSLAVSAADCLTGTVCAPAPAAPFNTSACIAQTGDVACPATGYSDRHVYYGGVDDERACSTCACGAVTGASCTGSVDIFSSTNGSCGGGEFLYMLPFSCDALNQQPSDFRVDLTLANGSCTPSAVAPTGTATPTQPTTVCCVP